MNEQFFDTFQKFKKNPDFELHLSKLKVMSENKVLGEIKIDEDVSMPKYGPDPDIFHYEDQLKGWNSEDLEDFTMLRDLYFQGGVDDLRFCRLSTAHLSSLPEYEDNETLNNLYYLLEMNKDPDIDLIEKLVTSDDEQLSTLGASLMMTFYT